MKNPLWVFAGVLAGAAVIAVVLYFTVFAANGNIRSQRIGGYGSPLSAVPRLDCKNGPEKVAELPADRGTEPNIDEVAGQGRDWLPDDNGADGYEVSYEVQSETTSKQTRIVWLSKDSVPVGLIDAERTVPGGPWRITAVSSCP